VPSQIKSAGAAWAAGEVGPAPSQLPSPAGGVRDACPVCRVRVRCLACFRGFGNVQRRVLTLPRPRKPSNNLFRPFRALENLQATCFGLSDASETFKQLVSAFPSPRKSSNNLFGPFRPLGASGTPAKFAGYGFFLRYPASFPAPAGAVRDVCQVCRVRVFWGTRPASLPRQGASGTPAKFAEYGFLRYPASFLAPAGDRATVCLQPPLATRELTTAKPPSLQCVRRSGGFFL